MHKDWYDATQNVQAKKARWTEEESLLLARREAQLLNCGEKFLNVALCQVFPTRTLESIKGQRRKASHKNLVAQHTAEYRNQAAQGVVRPEEVEQNEENPLQVTLQEARLSRDGTAADLPPEEDIQRINSLEDWGIILNFLCSLEPLKTKEYSADLLMDMVSSLKRKGSKEGLLEDVTIYLLTIFPPNRKRPFTTPAAKRGATGSGTQGTSTLSSRKKRRAEYARVQSLWRRNPCRCLRTILKDKATSNAPPKDIMIPFWSQVMTGGSGEAPDASDKRKVRADLWAPITSEEISGALPSLSTSPGPDGVTVRQLRAVPVGILLRIFNLLMICGRLPSHLLESKTTLIPKKDGADSPGDFRPITVSSVVTRTLHKIFASRISNSIDLDGRQKAFRPVDGCSENVFLLDMVLRYHREKFRPLFMASIDVAKAFDSVTHEAIRSTLEVMGIPSTMVDYIMSTYHLSKTRLSNGEWLSDPIHPTCGVKQGDPLSPIIFNMIVDRLLRRLPVDVGVRVGKSKVNAAAFADDLIFFAATPEGLQSLLNTSTDFLSKCGLSVNANKCFTVAIRNVPRQKKSVVDAKTIFHCQGRPLPALRRTSEWKYLGVPFTPEGRLLARPTDAYQAAIDILSKAPMKPQQRMFGLRVMVLPSLYHGLTLGRTNISVLKKLDNMTRAAARKWLALPSDTVKSYFHADVSDGGLSLPSMRYVIPILRLRRLRSLGESIRPTDDSAESSFLLSEIRNAECRLNDHGTIIANAERLKKWWAKRLHDSFDGNGLEESKKVPSQHAWVTEGNKFVSGRDYLNMTRLRINALPVRSRTSRGRLTDRSCRAGCRDTETLPHVLQFCPRTSDARIKRHNACITRVSQVLKTKGYRLINEPLFKRTQGNLKPDLLAMKDKTAVVLDATVVGVQRKLRMAHMDKVEKYKVLESMIKEKYDVDSVTFTSITLNWKGVWSKDSAEDLIRLGILRKSELKVISTRVLIGGLNIFSTFMRATRTGIG